MKKLLIILISALVALAACTKSQEVHPEIGDGNDELVTVGMKDVHVKYTRTDHAELQKVVFHYSLAEEQQFEATEMTKRATFFELTINDLVSDTLYEYYYELFYNSGETSITVQKTFHTQAFDLPEPPEPPTPTDTIPEGATNGLFTINENGDQVYYSKGNLQYQASTDTWRFAENQWDYVGDNTYGTVYENGEKCNNALLSETNNGWMDLFGWGTSGYDHGAVCYQPWSVSNTNGDYNAYGVSTYSLFDQTGQADWGYNAIINGGNQEGLWHTLTRDEFIYLVRERNTLSGMRYAKATVNEVQGIILFPDDWVTTTYEIVDNDIANVPCSSNIIDNSIWVEVFESNGAVFMPVTGQRPGNSVTILEKGLYWLATTTAGGSSYNICFDNTSLIPDDDCGDFDRYIGRAVRLVQDAR